MIKIENLKKVYRNNGPLLDVNAVINDGDVISVIGKSGKGKSTLLRCIDLLETPTSGHIYVDGTDITDPSADRMAVCRRMGMVFSSFNLFSHLNVIENIMMAPVDILHMEKQAAYDLGMELLKKVRLSNKAYYYPDELTGGQKQRIAIARTLAMDPDIILMDEPTSGLDPAMTAEVQAVIKELAHSGKTLLIATNEMSFARAICSRVFYMDEGIIYEEGTPQQIFDSPSKEKTRRFINGLRVLELFVIGSQADSFEMLNEIEQYCRRNQISRAVSNRMQLAVEELVFAQLIPMIEKAYIRITVEYSEITDTVVMKIRYNGGASDFRERSDPLSLAILKNSCERIEYRPEQLGRYENLATLVIRK